MCHRAPWALSLALLAGLSAVAAAQETPPASPAKEQSKGNWFTNLWPFNRPVPPKTAPKVVVKAPPVDNALLLKQETAAYLRRLEVCDKLLEIAQATQDGELEHRAEQLREQAKAILQQRIAQLPLSADDAALAGRLSPGDAAGRLTAGTAGRPSGSAVSQAPTREDRR